MEIGMTACDGSFGLRSGRGEHVATHHTFTRPRSKAQREGRESREEMAGMERAKEKERGREGEGGRKREKEG